jgi:hypothetical protein
VPISLPEERLEEPEYRKYKVAVRRLTSDYFETSS